MQAKRDTTMKVMAAKSPVEQLDAQMASRTTILTPGSLRHTRRRQQISAKLPRLAPRHRARRRAIHARAMPSGCVSVSLKRLRSSGTHDVAPTSGLGGLRSYRISPRAAWATTAVVVAFLAWRLLLTEGGPATIIFATAVAMTLASLIVLATRRLLIDQPPSSGPDGMLV